MSKRPFPLVSVVVPVYNGQDTVRKAIDGILAQTYPEREIVVVDDGSTDSSLDLLRGYGRRIQLVQQKHSGASVARNTGLSAARGEYIAFLDQDDTWIPEKLLLQVEILNKYPSIGLTFCNLELVNTKGERLGSTILDSSRRYSPSWADLLIGFGIVCSSFMGRKELMVKAGGFDADYILPGYEDNDFLLRLREITEFHYLDQCLGDFHFDEARYLRYQSNLLLYARKQWNNSKLQIRTNDRLRDQFVAFRLRDEFVESCGSALSYYARLRLKVEHKVSKETLYGLNEFHDSLGCLFGHAYKYKHVDLGKYELNPVNSLLLYLYLSRLDLQIAFPEVCSGDLSRLAHWATTAAKGANNDCDRSILVSHMNELERLRQKRT